MGKKKKPMQIKFKLHASGVTLSEVGPEGILKEVKALF
jgi:hypothetical protein